MILEADHQRLNDRLIEQIGTDEMGVVRQRRTWLPGTPQGELPAIFG